ncbi:hypothetical protein RUM43_004721 [Polyplax serrata]|uniref:Uncharacterized protein n=1 Tax=Polyplax serrata TaxID=468196 RepID=A0AAN8SB95_POLSC
MDQNPKRNDESPSPRPRGKTKGWENQRFYLWEHPWEDGVEHMKNSTELSYKNWVEVEAEEIEEEEEEEDGVVVVWYRVAAVVVVVDDARVVGRRGERRMGCAGEGGQRGFRG